SDVNSLVQAFRRVVRKCPENIAIEHGELRMTYLELDQRSEALAKELGSAEGKLVPVGLLVNRSLEMIVAVVAGLKSGCGYVPLDPMYPADRLQFMLESSGAQLLLAHSTLTELVPRYRGATLLLDNLLQETAKPSTTQIEDVPLGRAYVIYTSGSTGQPKGVSMGRRALDYLIDWQLRNTEVLEGGRTLQFSPLSFDVWFQETWATLCRGGTLVL